MSKLDQAQLSNTIVFWRQQLPRQEQEFNLRLIFEPVDTCTICDGTGTFYADTGEMPCLCQLHAEVDEIKQRWGAYNAIPRRYVHLDRKQIVQIEHALLPVERERFLLAIKATDCFIQNPQGNIIFTGAVGTGRTMLAAYVATEIAPIPTIFVSARQLLANLVNGTTAHSVDEIRGLVYSVPVLVIDDLTANPKELTAHESEQLYELIYHRWGEMLPVIITSRQPFSELHEAYGPILEHFRHDAQIFDFNWKPIHFNPVMAKSPLLLDDDLPVPETAPTPCPFLGVPHDTETWMSVASKQNHCHLPVVAGAIDLSHQASYCLSEQHVNCTLYRKQSERPNALPGDIRYSEKLDFEGKEKQAMLISVLGIILIIVGILLWVYLIMNGGLSDLLNTSALTGAMVVGTPAVFREPDIGVGTVDPDIDLEEAQPMAAVTEEAAIVEPTTRPTPVVPTPTATVQVVAIPGDSVPAVLAYETNMRHGPGLAYTILHVLPAGTGLAVSGRDELGIWLLAATDDGRMGWVAVTQIEGNIDLLPLPIAFEQKAAILEPELLVLAYDSNLRVGPGMNFDVITLLTAGQQYVLLGRDTLGNWAFVRSGDHLGWMAASQLNDETDILSYPVNSTIITFEDEEDSEDPQESTANASDHSTIPQLPGLFTIALESRVVTCSTYNDFTVDYKINISGQSVSIYRIEDGTSTSGSYNPRTGAFRTYGVHSFGQERLEGIIKYDGYRVTIEGTQEIIYFEDRCTGVWDIYGEEILR